MFNVLFSNFIYFLLPIYYDHSFKAPFNAIHTRNMNDYYNLPPLFFWALESCKIKLLNYLWFMADNDKLIPDCAPAADDSMHLWLTNADRTAFFGFPDL